MSARRFLIAGRVQGVGFRWFVARLARELGIRGTARNLQDGRVEITAAGESSSLSQLESALRTGPPGARVDRVEVVDVKDEASMPKGFSVS